MSDDSEIEPIVKKKYDYNVSVKNNIGRAEIVINKILESPTVSIEDPGGIIHIDNPQLGLKASIFFITHSSQQKKLIFKNILERY